MCGVVAREGVLDPKLRASIGAMTATLRHRGPDGQSVFTHDAAALGHRRLAIIDRAGGTQPMTNEDESCWIVFNGEIYNHRALRRRLLDRGHTFRTTSDTESILHAYEEFGTDCVRMLEGMFAFAVYDTRRRELLMARDRLGKKPLYYAELGGALHFASEIKAIRTSPVWDPTINLPQLEQYLSLGYFVAPDTVYKNVRSLPPAHWLRLRDGHIEIRRYWDIERFDDHPATGAALEDQVEEALRVAVTDRLESEVPLGTFLSGGIDSGLVVSFMAEALGPGVTTTSVGFGEAAHNELAAAGLTAARFETRHHVEVIEPRLDEVLGRIADAFDEPFADASAVPTLHLSGMARRHVTVALSGDGGDEAFTGYSQRYVPHAIESIARPLVPGAPGRAAARWLAARWPRTPGVPRWLRWSILLDNIARDPAEAYYADLCVVKPREVRRLLGLPPLADLSGSAVYDVVTAQYRRCGSSSAVQRAQYADMHLYLPNDVLVKVDRMSMANSLEVRSPLLDQKVMDFMASVPASLKLKGNRGKHILKEAMKSQLPSGIINRPKQGFSIPVGEWLRSGCRDYVADWLFAQNAFIYTYLRPSFVQKLWTAHQRGADYSSELWTLLMLELWGTSYRHSVRGEAVPPIASSHPGARTHHKRSPRP